MCMSNCDTANNNNNSNIKKSNKLASLEKHLEGLKALDLNDDLNNAIAQWESVLEIDTYIKDGVMHVIDTTYCDIMTFVRWELYKINQMLCTSAGLFSRDVKMNLV